MAHIQLALLADVVVAARAALAMFATFGRAALTLHRGPAGASAFQLLDLALEDHAAHVGFLADCGDLNEVGDFVEVGIKLLLYHLGVQIPADAGQLVLVGRDREPHHGVSHPVTPLLEAHVDHVGHSRRKARPVVARRNPGVQVVGRGSGQPILHLLVQVLVDKVMRQQPRVSHVANVEGANDVRVAALCGRLLRTTPALFPNRPAVLRVLAALRRASETVCPGIDLLQVEHTQVGRVVRCYPGVVVQAAQNLSGPSAYHPVDHWRQHLEPPSGRRACECDEGEQRGGHAHGPPAAAR
mmetsp:Transcript_30785/g.93141  ORF Transcript_30785/g.93141 Transcript_30785/m.93141 type:complete len:298 (-) Transcript_30785:202-1095(-)